MNREQLTGDVVKEPFAKGSKSERDAVLLISGGRRFVLRRQGGNAFQDPDLDRLVGKRIQCSGIITGFTFLMSEWSEIPPTR